MILSHYDEELHFKTLKKEGRDSVNALIRILIKENRLDDLKRAAEDSEFEDKLLKEFGL